GFGAGGLRGVECELCEKTLTRPIPCGDLLQLFQIADTGRRVIVKPLKMRLIPLTKEAHLSNPWNCRVAKPGHRGAELTPMRRRCGWDADAIQRFEYEVAFGEPRKHVSRRRWSDARQKLEHAEPSHGVSWVLGPTKHAQDVLNLRRFVGSADEFGLLSRELRRKEAL